MVEVNSLMTKHTITGLMNGVINNISHHGSDPVGVAVSGGIDSSVILHEVANKNSNVHVYSICWGDSDEEKQESEVAKQLAKAYGASYTSIVFSAKMLLETIYNNMKTFDKPRWNLWPMWIVEAVKDDDIKHLYVGEGSDEILGYTDRCYIRGWISQVEYISPVWKTAGKLNNVTIHAPFLELETSLDDNIGLPVTFYNSFTLNKQDLWNVYKHKLRSKIIYPKKPGLYYYHRMASELNCTYDNVKTELMRYACLAWATAR